MTVQNTYMVNSRLCIVYQVHHAPICNEYIYNKTALTIAKKNGTRYLGKLDWHKATAAI